MANIGTWQRDERTFVYLSERRARYASVAKTRDGRLITLFTRQTEQQEAHGTGDLILIQAIQGDRWWSKDRVAYEGQSGEPRAYGTLTALRSGRILAPFAEVGIRSSTSSVRILTSEDNGGTFSASDPVPVSPLHWAAPYGRICEVDGDLVMPVFGCRSERDLKSTRHICGVLRSRDGGATWGDWSLIAEDPTGDSSYEFSAVLQLPDGTLVCVFTARRLTPSIDAPQILMRTYSSDGGRTWSPAEQLNVGAWPGLALVDENTAVCAYTVWCGWGQMLLMASNDGFRTFTQDLVFLEHGWLPIPDHYPERPFHPDTKIVTESGRPFWAYHPIPLPPVVPHLEGDWEAGHYGFPSVLALSKDRLLVAFGNRQQGTGYCDPPRDVSIPIELERIEAISFDRLPSDPTPHVVRTETPYRWEMAESWTPEQWQKRGTQPLAGKGSVLRSGRWVQYQAGEGQTKDSHKISTIGRARGYWIQRSERRISMPPGHWAYSDDKGTTWTRATLAEPSPLAALSHQCGQVFEEADGTVVAPFYGYMNDEDMSRHTYGACICRSRDGGKTWGDWSILGYDVQDRYFSYCEPTVLPVSEDLWICFMRTETENFVPWFGAMMMRTVSTDRGRTWSKPEVCVSGSQPALVHLSDGGLAFIIRSTGRQGPGVYISYDKGMTWDYALAGPYNTWDGGVLDEEHFWAFANNEVVIYRRTNKEGT